MYRFASLKRLLAIASGSEEEEEEVEEEVLAPYVSENVSDSVIDKVIDLWTIASQSNRSLTRVKERANELGFKWMGSGAYRFAVQISRGLVAKIQYDKEGYMMNKEEYNNQNVFMDHFPRVYGHGTGSEGNGFGWLIMEKVNVIGPKDAKKMLEWFPELSRDIPALAKYLRIEGPGEFDEFDAFVWLLEPCIENYGELEFYMRKFSIYKNTTFIEICAAIASLGYVDVGDLMGGNLGWSNDGRFLIIDSSL